MWHAVTTWAYHSVLDPGNLLASGLAGFVGGYLGVWKRHVRPQLDKIHEIHQHLDPTHPFTLGGDQDGENRPGR